jgi:hypothetical protein
MSMTRRSVPRLIVIVLADLVPGASAAQSLPEGNGRDTLLSCPS